MALRTTLPASLLLVAALLAPRPARAAVPRTDPPPRTPPTHLERELIVAQGASPQRTEAPSFAPPSYKGISRLAFQSYRDGNWEIYVADGDGSGETRLTSNAASDVLPRLSHDAERVVFASNRDGNYEIYTIKVDGNGLVRLTSNGASDLDPAWSPDGTRIAFASNRDGNYEIYVMNADGTGVTRMTNDGADDYQPAWSPNGAQIAFSTSRGAPANTGGRIWVMNANGSNQHYLGGNNFSERPAWSPDGTKIGFDGDYNNDGWLETMWMPSGGGSPTVLFFGSSSGRYDNVMGAWSWDSVAVAYSSVWWVYSGGQWYLTQTAVGYQPLGGSGQQMTTSLLDMNPDWRKVNLAAPSTTVTALPAVSPADFYVLWAGALGNTVATGFTYEIQWREGLTGTWTLLTSAASTAPNFILFHGIGGRTYYFRSRGTDSLGFIEAWPTDADQWTTVEALPPVTSMTALAPLTRTPAIPLQWGGTDPGGSGIANYDVEVRADADGVWTRLLTGTLQTSLAYAPPPGKTYYFRARGVDKGGNVEGWPPDDGDAQTTLYRWRVAGKTRDAQAVLLPGTTVDVARGGTPLAAVSGQDGIYDALAITSTSFVTVTWTKPGYLPLPPTVFGIEQDLEFDAWLPPADNVIADWGFEAAAPGAWLMGGGPMPTSTVSIQHTGARAALLGGTAPGALETVSRSAADSHVARAALDPFGGFHIVWLEGSGSAWNVLYANRAPNGSWSLPYTLTASSMSVTSADSDIDEPQIVSDAAGNLSVIWRDLAQGRIYYASRQAGGEWAPSQIIATGLNTGAAAGPGATAARLAAGPTGDAHVLWHNTAGARSDIYYRHRAPDGAWDPVETVTASEYGTDSAQPALAVDGAGTAHAAWKNGIGYYASRPLSGTWSTPIGTTVWPFLVTGSRIAVDGGGLARLGWVGSYNGVNGVIYAEANNGLIQNTQFAYTSTQGLKLDDLIVDPSGVTRLAWSRADGAATAGALSGPGWTLAQVAPPGAVPSRSTRLAVTATGVWAILRDGSPTTVLRCVKISATGAARDFGRCAGADGGANRADPIVDAGSRIHVAVPDGPSGSREVRYFQIDDALPGGTWVRQTITIPASAATRGLSFVYWLTVPSGEAAPVLSVTLEGGITTTIIFTTSAAANGWTHVWRDIPDWAGQAATLTLQLDPRSGWGSASARLDEITLGAVVADAWVELALPDAALPGEIVEGLIRYGNQGAGLLSGVALTVTLPDGLSLVDAEGSPSVNGSTLVWSLTDLAAQSGPFSLRFTATVGPPTLTPLAALASLATSGPDINPANNQAKAALSAVYRASLPVVLTP